MDDHPKSIVKSAVHFLSGTFLSRVTGLAREVVMAFCFGAGPLIAAFLVGYRWANLMRRLFGEGSLLAGFSPYFEEARKESAQKAAVFFRDLFASLFVGLIGIILLLEGGLWSWIHWGEVSSETQEILFLTMLMLPGVLFICLYALFSALLQCEKRYFLPGVAPVIFNLVLLGAIWKVKDWAPKEAMVGLSISVVVAFFFQWVIVIPRAFSFLNPLLTIRQWLQAKLFSKELMKMLRAMTFTIIGVGAIQINTALDTVFARAASLSGPAYLNYAIRLYQLPLALFGVALASALLPPLSRAIQHGALDHYRKMLHFALSRTFSLMLPCTIAIFVLGASAVNLIYGHGEFDNEATVNTVTCLWAYGLGLVPAVFVLLLSPAFYAQKDYRTPLFASLCSVGLNVGLNAFLVFGLGWGATSIALATALAATANCYCLAVYLKKRVGPIFDRQAWWACIKAIGASAIAGIGTLALGHYLLGDSTIQIALGSPEISFPRETLTQFVHFFVLAGVFALLFFSYAWMFNLKELLEILGLKKNLKTTD